MRYTLSDLLGALLACAILGVFGFFFFMWLGVPLVGGKGPDVINPTTGRPLTGAEARQAELIDNNPKALAEYQQTHKGQDSPFTP